MNQSSFGKQYLGWFKQELVLLLREPVAIFFSLAFPLVIYFFLGIAYADMEVAPGVKFIDVMYPTLIGTVAANLLLMGMPIYFAELRARGVNRRYQILPLRTGVFPAAIVSAMLVLVLLSSLVVTAVVGFQHGIRPSVASPAFIGVMLGMIAWLCGFGSFLGTLPFGSRTVQAISAAIFFVLFFGSGAATPIDGLPQWLQQVIEFNPLKHWFDWLVAIYTGQPVSSDTVWKALAVIPVVIALMVISRVLQRREINQ